MAIPIYLILQIYAPSLKYSLSRMVEIGSHLTKSIVDVKLDNPTSADSNLFVLIYVSFIYLFRTLSKCKLTNSEKVTTLFHYFNLYIYNKNYEKKQENIKVSFCHFNRSEDLRLSRFLSLK